MSKARIIPAFLAGVFMTLVPFGAPIDPMLALICAVLSAFCLVLSFAIPEDEQ